MFSEIVRKYDRKTLDFKSFIHFSNVYPEMLDFFDIFNNNILKNRILKISAGQIEELDCVHNRLVQLIQTCSVCKFNHITLLRLQKKQKYHNLPKKPCVSGQQGKWYEQEI
jgi:hypothetical protein